MKQLNKTKARQGFTTRHMTIVLTVSILLAIGALAIVMGIF